MAGLAIVIYEAKVSPVEKEETAQTVEVRLDVSRA